MIDEWFLDPPSDDDRSELLELLERRYDSASTVFCTQYAKNDRHQRLGSDVHAGAIMDRIVHNTNWIETGNTNMREHAAVAGLTGAGERQHHRWRSPAISPGPEPQYRVALNRNIQSRSRLRILI